jgi:hypothetical protein
MVHALREAWRVLVPGGTLLDLRPVAESYPIEIVRGQDIEVVGSVEPSAKAFADDAASDDAVRAMVRERLLAARRRIEFECALWWDTVDEMRDSFESWTRHVAPSPARLARARAAEARGGATRLRSRGRLILSIYGRRPLPPTP